jgi:gamma-glutamyl-gamma-aminobutyrate hydrolase PuuD
MSKIVKGTKDWECKTFPQARGKKAFVLPGAFYGQCVLLMAEAGFGKASNVEEADVVVFIGGEDINPLLYDQKNVASSFSRERDDLEIEIFKRAKAKGKVCFGICRGAQFLHAMNGGQLWQDVNNHAGRNHFIVDLDEDVRLEVTSLHHQMLQDNDDIEVIAVTESQIATTFYDEHRHITLKSSDPEDPEIEIEAGCYHSTKCFFVQGHPEVGSLYYKTWTMSKLHDLMNEWASVDNLNETLGNKVVTKVSN